MKTCTKCKQEFPATSEYFSIGRKSLRSACKSCRTEQSKKIILSYSKDKLNAYKKKYRENNRDAIRSGHRAYKKANPEKTRKNARISDARRRAKIKGNGWEPYTEEQMLSKYGSICYLCNEEIDLNAPRQCGRPGWEKGLQKDHVIAIDNGGPDTLDNVRPTHGLCNNRKSNKENNEEA